MNKKREAFEKWCEENGEVVTIEGRKCYPKKEWEIWQAAIAHKQTKINRLESIIKDQRLLFDAREARLEKFIREFKENT